MNEDAFARRFYADRSELESLRIQLTVERPTDGAAEQENYSLRPENFHLPPIAFSDEELAALQTALSLLDGEFAYAEPLRLALQQITWGRPSPLRAPEQRSVALGITASAGGHELSARLAKVETAIFRNKTIVFEYYTMERDETGPRRVDPYHLLFQGGQFYLLGYAHEREAIRVFRLSRIRGKVSYATKAEHDFRRPEDFDPRAYAQPRGLAAGRPAGRRRGADLRADRLAGRTPLRPLRGDPRAGRARRGGRALEAAHAASDVVFATEYSSPRTIVSWVLGLGANARLLGPESLTRRAAQAPGAAVGAPRRGLSRSGRRDGRGKRRAPVLQRGRRAHGRGARGERASGLRARTRRTPRWRPEDGEETTSARGSDAAISPERFARLVTLASILIHAGRAGEPRVDRGRVRASAAQRRGAARGRQRAERRELRRRLLCAVCGNPRNRGWGDDRGRPRALQRQLRPARAAAAGRGQGAGRGDRPDRRAHPRGLAVERAREDRRRARRGPDGAGTAGRPRRQRRLGRGALGLHRDRRAPVDRAGVLQGERGRVLSAHGRALRAHERARGLVCRLLRSRARRRAPLPPGPDQARGGHQTRRSSPVRRSIPPAEVDGWLRTGEVRGLAHRARMGLLRARPLGARGPPRRLRAHRRLGRSSS